MPVKERVFDADNHHDALTKGAYVDASMIIMLGAMVGAGLLCVPLVRMLKISRLVRASAKQRHGDLNRTVHDLVGLAEIRHKHNLVTMAQSAATMKDPLLVRGVTLALEGQKPQEIRSQLETSYLGAQGNGEVNNWEIARSASLTLSLACAAVGAIQVLVASLTGGEISAITGVLVALSIFTGMMSSVMSRADWTATSGVRRAEVLRRLIVVEGVISLAEGLDAIAMRRRLMGMMPGQGAANIGSTEIRRAA